MRFMSCQMDRIGELSAFILIGDLGVLIILWVYPFVYLCFLTSGLLTGLS